MCLCLHDPPDKVLPFILSFRIYFRSHSVISFGGAKWYYYYYYLSVCISGTVRVNACVCVHFKFCFSFFSGFVVLLFKHEISIKSMMMIIIMLLMFWSQKPHLNRPQLSNWGWHGIFLSELSFFSFSFSPSTSVNMMTVLVCSVHELMETNINKHVEYYFHPPFVLPPFPVSFPSFLLFIFPVHQEYLCVT